MHLRLQTKHFQWLTFIFNTKKFEYRPGKYGYYNRSQKNWDYKEFMIKRKTVT